MRPVLKLTLAGLLALAIVVCFGVGPADRLGAAAPPGVKRAPKAPEASDKLDYVFLASDRPVRIRVHLRVGDKPYSVAWDSWMDQLFVWFDKDGDGYLNKTEAGRLVQPQFFVNQLQGSIGGRGNNIPFAMLDTNKDGKVSKEEFRDYYRKNGISPLRFYNNNGEAASAKQTNNAIYKRLEVNPEGKLTQEKLFRLPGLLTTLDENEDELLSAQELALEDSTPSGYGPTPAPRRMRGKAATAPAVETGLLEVQPTTPPGSLAQQVVTRYDRNKDGKLGREEIGFDKALFDQLDANHDGLLDARELTAYFQREPDLTFRVRVGKLDAGGAGGVVAGALARIGFTKTKPAPSRIEVMGAKGSPLAKQVRPQNPETVAFRLGDAHFDLQANEGFSNNAYNLSQFYLQQFDAVVDKKKGYVDIKQEKDNAMMPFLFFIFPQADRNADGKLTRKELEAYLNLMGQGSSAFVTIQVNDQGRSLFNVIDSNGDGQLSIREMRTAWERVKPLCKDGKSLQQADLPRTIRISMSQGNTFFRARPVVVFGNMAQPGRPATTGPVPVWFTKMDRNNDGDISPKEWLGTEEEFRMIDTDGDGLISAEEARQYEARQKKADKTKEGPPAPAQAKTQEVTKPK
jgi:Ca2+-binding EF-hand superfamily protein